MRILLALPVVVAACNQPPTVEITSPAADTLVTDHATITVAVDVTDEDLTSLALLLDGAPATASFDPLTLPEDGACDDGCALTLAWGALEAREGAHTITVIATDSHEELGTADLAIAFEDVPTAMIQSPAGADQLGVGELGIVVAIKDRGDLTAGLSIDGAPVDADLTGDCRYGCQLTYPWDATALSGEHQLDATVTDAGDRAATATQTVTLGDIPFATAIEVTNEVDNLGIGSLEIEIHLSDADTGAFIGCTGEAQGMEDVDDSNVRYDLLATFIDGTGARLGADALAGRNLEITVMEDDNYACPGTLDLVGDDHVGTSAPIPAAELAGHPPMSFQDVVDLELDVGRPFTR